MAQSDSHNDAYRALPDSDLAEKRDSQPSIRDIDASDGADEKLLKKEGARIVSADMPDVKYKAGDQVNGEAKIEIDSNQRTFTGLTKEELLKYQDDPFWVRLRWAMFVLFWAMWLCMLAGAIAIIVNSPTCKAPAKWYQNAIVDMSEESFETIESRLPYVRESGARAVIVPSSVMGDVYNETIALRPFKTLAEKAKSNNVKLIVEMEASHISKAHPWFKLSEQQEAEYKDYLVWTPNNTLPKDAEPSLWSLSSSRQAYYRHSGPGDSADVNMRSGRVVRRFTEAMQRWLEAGASGIRLKNFANLLAEEAPSSVSTNDKQKTETKSVRSELKQLLLTWKKAVESFHSDTVLMVRGGPDGDYLESSKPVLSVVPGPTISADESVADIAKKLSPLPQHPTTVQVSGSKPLIGQLFALTLLVPTTSIVSWGDVYEAAGNGTWKVDPEISLAAAVRDDTALSGASLEVKTLAEDKLLAITRWSGSFGYLGVYNPQSTQVNDSLASLARVPPSIMQLPNTTIQSKDAVFEPMSTTMFKFEPAPLE